MLNSIVPSLAADAALLTTATVSTSTEPFSRAEVFSTLRALASAYASYEADYQRLCLLPTVDLPALSRAHSGRVVALRALHLHARRLLPHVRPGIATDACDRLADWLVREAEEREEVTPL